MYRRKSVVLFIIRSRIFQVSADLLFHLLYGLRSEFFFYKRVVNGIRRDFLLDGIDGKCEYNRFSREILIAVIFRKCHIVVYDIPHGSSFQALRKPLDIPGRPAGRGIIVDVDILIFRRSALERLPVQLTDIVNIHDIPLADDIPGLIRLVVGAVRCDHLLILLHIRVVLLIIPGDRHRNSAVITQRDMLFCADVKRCALRRHTLFCILPRRLFRSLCRLILFLPRVSTGDSRHRQHGSQQQYNYSLLHKNPPFLPGPRLKMQASFNLCCGCAA